MSGRAAGATTFKTGNAYGTSFRATGDFQPVPDARMAATLSPRSRPSTGFTWLSASRYGERTRSRRYGVAVAITLLALAGARIIDVPFHVHTNLLFVAAVAVSAWYGGRGAGLVSSMLSVLAVVLFFSGSRPALRPLTSGEIVYLAAFVLVAWIVGETTESLRAARAEAVVRADALEELNVELEQQVEEVRTLSEHLCESNDALAKAVSAAEQVAARTTRLQEVTAALSQARTESEVADVVLGQGLAVVEGVRAVLARMDGRRFEVIRAVGNRPRITARLCALSIDDTTPLTTAAKTGEAVWLASIEELRERFPWTYERFGVISSGQTHVALPLRHAEGIVGALSISFADANAVGMTDRALMLLLAQAAADALMRARSFDVEHVARREAETLAQARADVLGIVTHDLRNPLNVISSGGSLLLEVMDLPASERRKLLELMQRAAGQMNRLIGDLLEATRLQAGRLTLELGDVDACRMVRETEETLRPVASERRIDLRSHVPERECVVRADEGRVLQVLGNLAGNALKFVAPGGQVTLSACPVASEVVFSVTDNGPGIPPEHQARLFDGFWQARRGDRRGVGLGLTIAKGIVEAHSGRVWLESTVGVGSTFSFALPARTEYPNWVGAGSPFGDAADDHGEAAKE
jgi:signal transduction histidine kinase